MAAGGSAGWRGMAMAILVCGLVGAATVAATLMRSAGDETPWPDIDAFCDYLGMGQDEYFSVMERFRNHDIWRRTDDGWRIDGFLIDDFAWPPDTALAKGRGRS